MTAPSPAELVAALKRYGLNPLLKEGYADPRYQANAGMTVWQPEWFIMHHTAGAKTSIDTSNYLAYGFRNSRGQVVRGCHLYVDRLARVHVIYARGTWHAGAGGPYGGVPRDRMNSYSYGIEIETPGIERDLTSAQITASAKVAAAVLDLLGQPTSRVINHRTWAPLRKVDTRYSDAFWQTQVDMQRQLHPYKGTATVVTTTTGRKAPSRTAPVFRVRRPGFSFTYVETRIVKGETWLRTRFGNWYLAKHTTRGN